MRAKSVVLPAPFGPINAVMLAAGTDNVAASTANRPPKRRDTDSTMSSGSTTGYLNDRLSRRSQAAHQARTCVGECADKAARGESDDQHQHGAVNHQIKAGDVAGHQLGTFAERFYHQRTNDRPENRADAADDRRQQRLNGNPSTVGNRCVDEQKVLRIEAAGRRGDRGRDDHGSELDSGCIDPEREGGILVLAHRDQPGAEPRMLKLLRNHQRSRDQRENDKVESCTALELERLRAQVELDQNADTGAGDRHHACDDAQNLGEGQRHQRKIGGAQARTESKSPDDRADHAAGGNAGGAAKPGVDAVAHLQNGGDVGAGAEERRMAERVLPAVAADDVPALPGKRDHQRHHEEIEHDVGVHDERHSGEQRHHHNNRRISPHALAPNKPRGRTSSTTMKIRKIPTWPSDSPRKKPLRLSTTPMARPPISAPGTEPMPPRTTMVKAIRMKALPALGLT